MTNNKKTTVFIVDKDPDFLREFKAQFEAQTRYAVHTFATGQECLASLSLQPDIIFLDIDLNLHNPSHDTGFQVLVRIKSMDPKIHVIVLSTRDQLHEVMNCQKYEAYDYLVKSETLFTRSLQIIARLYQQRRIENHLSRFKTSTYILITALAIIITVIPILVYFFPDTINTN